MENEHQNSDLSLIKFGEEPKEAKPPEAVHTIEKGR